MITMSWATDFIKFGHQMFITFIELKIEGSWLKKTQTFGNVEMEYEILVANSIDNSMVQVIEPDGLRRILHFTEGGTIAIHQNVLSYHPKQVEEIAVDEKEQSGKGKTRDTLR